MLKRVLRLDDATMIIILNVFSLLNELVGCLLLLILQVLAVLSKPFSIRVVNLDAQINVLLYLLFLEDFPELTELARCGQRKSLLLISKLSVLTERVDTYYELLSDCGEFFVGNLGPFSLFWLEGFTRLESSFFGFLLSLFELLALSILRISLLLLTDEIRKSIVNRFLKETRVVDERNAHERT